jgi:short-subunit dehydrogenase
MCTMTNHEQSPRASAPGAVIVVGAGPGVGVAVARRFGREGHAVGLVARSRARLDDLVHALRADGVDAAAAAADVRKTTDLRAALGELAARLGPPEILCFSPLPDVGLIRPVLETTPEDLAAALELNVVGAAGAVGEVLPAMRADGRGTLLFTTGGAALTPSPERAVSGVTYGAETVYVRMLHDALASEGIHAAQTVIVGAIGPGRQHEPAVIAEHLWQRHVGRGEALTTIR